jgi:hypothetical protein
MPKAVLPPFSLSSVSARMPRRLAGAAIDVNGWEEIKKIVAPYVWSWYDEHKDMKVTKLFGVYTIRVGSFGIAEMVITAIFGARPAI